MHEALPPRRPHRPGWTKEDEDVMACQVISAFSWILLILLINFFLLHKSNSIPEAEANYMERQAALRPPELPQPLPQLARLPDQVPWEVSREFLEDDYKPNYYFLYKDQVRFVDRIPEKKKTVVASLKTVVPVTVKKEEEKPKPLLLEWLDMTLVEEVEPEKQERKEEPPPPTKTIRVAMVENLDLDMRIVQDTPTPVVPPEPRKIVKQVMPKMRASVVDMDMQIVQEAPEPVVPQEPKEVPKQAIPRMRAAVMDMDMEIMDQAPPEEIPRVVAPVPQPKQPVMRTVSGADYVSLPMEIAPEASSFPTTAMPSNQPARKGTAHRTLIAKGPAGPATGVPMSLDIGENRETVSRSGRQGSIKKETKGARFAAVTGKGMGGIDLPSGILEGEGQGKGYGKGPAPVQVPSAAKAPVRVTLQTSKGSIRLGTPLAFALAGVGSETHTGSAYVRNSTHLKRLLEQRSLPEEPVTVSTEEATGGRNGSNRLIAVSYSRAQVVLQYANGKQHVINLVQGEPYPRFDMRLSADGTDSVPVGTKLEEITSCLSTLQQVLKE
jgi:hypothetical protein